MFFHARNRRFVSTLVARTFVLGLLCSILSDAFPVELPDPQLTLVVPAGGNAGESVAVSITGSDLDDGALRFTHPGIIGTVDAKDKKKFKVDIAKDVPPGRYDVRVTGKFGVSNPRTFEVATHPEITCDGKNLGRETALGVTLPCVVNGTALPQRTAWFKIALLKGHTLSIDCHASNLDSRIVPFVTLIDLNGRELLRARDTAVVWKAESDGPIFLALRDYLSNGGNEHFYRLHLQDAASEPQIAVETPLVFWPSSKDAKPETEPNDLAHPMPITLPCEISGQFFPVGDVDSFKFDAKKGEVWWLEVISQRLGIPTNPRLIVQRLTRDASGVETAADVLELNDGPPTPGSPDFEGNHLDPVGRFEVKDDGTYRVSLRDLNNTLNDDPTRRYTLNIRHESPDFTLIAIPVPPTENKPGAKNDGPVITVRGSNIRPGEILPVRVLVLRRDGFKGDVSLSAEGLPDGVAALPTVIGGETQDTHLFLQAAPTAKTWSGAIRIVGKATIDGKEISHIAKTSTPVWSSKVSEFVEPSRWRFAQEFTLGVVTDIVFPTHVVADGKPLEGIAGGKVKFAFQVTRSSEFKDAFKLKPAGVAGLDKAKEMEVSAKATQAEYELDLTPLKLTQGTYTFWFKGQDKGKVPIKGKPEDLNVVVYSTPVIVHVNEPKKEPKK